MSELKPCPFCGEPMELRDYPWLDGTPCYEWRHVDVLRATRKRCPIEMAGYDTEEEAIEAWNTRAERTCKLVPGKMHYGDRRPKCSECGQSMGDRRWKYCPNCGSRVIG